MGTTLTGLTPATTYDALIKVGDNGPLTGALKVLSDGLGTNLPMEASTTGINFTGALQQSGVAVPTQANLATKQDTLVSGTNIKTINSTSLLGSGNVAVQDVLVSGTNIKTINGTSVLGPGNIAVVTSPSGVAGAIQFSNGSAFASDAANLFWDDPNNRLGIGTNTPTNTFEIASTSVSPFKALTTAGYFRSTYVAGGVSGIFDYLGATGFSFPTDNVLFGSTSSIGGARVGIKGSGSTSATTSLLVQNSAGVSSLQVTDDGSVFNYGKGGINTNTIFGRAALGVNTSGIENTAFGLNSLAANTSGSYNAAFGLGSLATNTIGEQNTAVGRDSMLVNSSGVNNTAVGQQSLRGNTSGGNNAVCGHQAFLTNSTGSSNSALGQATSSGNFSGSVILGREATATASNQFVVGSSTTNAGAVNSTSDVPATFLWSVRINGTNYKILMTT